MAAVTARQLFPLLWGPKKGQKSKIKVEYQRGQQAAPFAHGTAQAAVGSAVPVEILAFQFLAHRANITENSPSPPDGEYGKLRLFPTQEGPVQHQCRYKTQKQSSP